MTLNSVPRRPRIDGDDRSPVNDPLTNPILPDGEMTPLARILVSCAIVFGLGIAVLGFAFYLGVVLGAIADGFRMVAG